MNKSYDLTSLEILTEKELFLKRFLEHYPEYRSVIIGQSVHKETDYDRLMYLMKSQWHKELPNHPFFLEGTSFHLEEDFFIPMEENVSVRQGFRYMPLILHSHQFIELNYIVKSNGCFMVTNDSKQELNDGDIILCPPGFFHCFEAYHDQCIILDVFIRVTTFDTAFFHLLNNNDYLSTVFTNALYHPGEGCILWHCKNDSKLKEILLTALSESHSREKYKNRMTELLIMQFFLQLMRNHEQEASFSMPNIRTADEQFQSLLNYMCAHYQTVTLSQLATQFNYSERQIIRLLKKYSKKGFSELLLDIRMNKAIQFLKNPSMSIPQIASKLGYASNAYFIKVFKKEFTFTPEEFRKRLEKMQFPDS